jgi:ribonuclease/clavin/mitogillin
MSPQPATLSACVILLAPGATALDAPRIWLARRVQSQRFLGGFHAFIGGALETEDGPRTDAESLRRCAARELYEEFGCVFTTRRGLWLEQPCEEVSLPARLELLGESLDVARYEEVGRWTTSPWAPARYETEFFLCVLSRDEFTQLAAHSTHVMLERAGLEAPAWHTAEEWLRLHEYGEVLFTLPTLEYVRELERRAPKLLQDTHARAAWRHDEHTLTDPLRRFAHTAHTWMVPLKSPTLLPATHTNCVVIGDLERFVIIDPGAEDAPSGAPLYELLDALFAQGAECEAIVLTHHHPDHLSGVTLLAERYGQAWPVWAHALTTPLLSRRAVPQGVARELRDGELLCISAAHTLEVLHTPGHAPGHVALMHRESRAVFCGDLVASQGTILVAPPRGHMGDYLASLARVQALKPSSLHPAHGWPVRDAHAHLEHYLTHRQKREQRAIAALAERPGESLSALDLVPIVYQDVPMDVWPLAAMSLEAHLIHLDEEHPQISRLMNEESDIPGHYCYHDVD